MAGFSHAEGLAFWRRQLPALGAGETLLFVAEQGTRLVATVLLIFAHQPERAAPRRDRQDAGPFLAAPARDRPPPAHGGGGRQRAAGRTLLLLDTETGSAGDALYRRCGWIEIGQVPDHAFRPDGHLAATSLFYKTLGPHRGIAADQ